MRVLLAKVFISATFWTLLLVGHRAFASNCTLPLMNVPDSYLFEQTPEPEPGYSSFVKPGQPYVFFMGEDSNNHEEDGNWDAEYPEGVFCQDFPDEQSPATLFTWRILLIPSIPIQDWVHATVLTLHPGAIYPPPQC